METINVQIDISTPTGKRLLREVEKHPRVAKIQYPLPKEIVGQKTYTLEESFEECCDILSEHYKCDVRKL
ncbi:MAG: hypothetical protein PHT07_03645 [Paludibacter sp.]|nr:hypothetical protein [Paludibacter sp.]